MLTGVNKVMRAYIYWDFVVNSAWGLLAPVFTVFLIQTVASGNVLEGAKVAGFATFFYWITKSILQIPIANYLDKNHGEIDDFWFYFLGTIMTGFVPLGFLFSVAAWQIYALNIFHAVGMSMVIPSSYAIYVRHTDKGKEAYEGALDSTLLGVGVGITGAVGGVLVGIIGFKAIFILVALFTFISSIFIWVSRKGMLPKMPQGVHELPVSPDKENIAP